MTANKLRWGGVLHGQSSRSSAIAVSLAQRIRDAVDSRTPSTATVSP